MEVLPGPFSDFSAGAWERGYLSLSFTEGGGKVLKVGYCELASLYSPKFLHRYFSLVKCPIVNIAYDAVSCFSVSQ